MLYFLKSIKHRNHMIIHKETATKILSLASGNPTNNTSADKKILQKCSKWSRQTQKLLDSKTKLHLSTREKKTKISCSHKTFSNLSTLITPCHLTIYWQQAIYCRSTQIQSMNNNGNKRKLTQ